MALVTGDLVVSSPEKPSLSCLLYIYIYIRIYQTVFRRFPLSAGQLTARMTASPANSVERAINFSPVEILARSVSVLFSLPPSSHPLSFSLVIYRNKFFNFTINLPLSYELQKKCFVQIFCCTQKLYNACNTDMIHIIDSRLIFFKVRSIIIFPSILWFYLENWTRLISSLNYCNKILI